MPIRCHVKKGDEVVVLAGKDKGKRGRVIRVFPKKQRVLGGLRRNKPNKQVPNQDRICEKRR